MISIADKFREPIMKMIQQSRKQHVITEENVYQEGNKANLELIYQILDALILPGSRVDAYRAGITTRNAVISCARPRPLRRRLALQRRPSPATRMGLKWPRPSWPLRDSN